LIPETGYEKASSIVKIAREEKISIKEAAIKSGFLTEEKFESLITPESVCRLGN